MQFIQTLDKERSINCSTTISVVGIPPDQIVSQMASTLDLISPLIIDRSSLSWRLRQWAGKVAFVLLPDHRGWFYQSAKTQCWWNFATCCNESNYSHKLTVELQFYLIYYQQVCIQPPYLWEFKQGIPIKFSNHMADSESITESMIQDWRYECSH